MILTDEDFWAIENLECPVVCDHPGSGSRDDEYTEAYSHGWDEGVEAVVAYLREKQLLDNLIQMNTTTTTNRNEEK